MSDTFNPPPDGKEAASERTDPDTSGSRSNDTYEELTVPPGAVCEPATSLINETGSWRETRPVINHESCTGCGLCVTFCPDGAVKRVDGASNAIGGQPADRFPVPRAAKHVGKQQVAIDYRYCKGCDICVQECPIDAIHVIPEVR